MRKVLGWVTVLAIVVIAACARPVAEGLTGSDEVRVPMPSFAYSFVGCLSWSCSSGQCQNDPAVWGACCTYVSPDPEEPGYERPSCGGPSYCDQYPARCAGDLGPDPGLAASYCFHANVGHRNDDPDTSICSDPTLPYPIWESNLCGGLGTIDEFTACYPTSGIN